MARPPHRHVILPGPDAARLGMPLARLLGAGRRRWLEAGYEQLLCALFQVPAQDGEMPLGALAWMGEAGEPGDRIWMRADPVHYQLLRDSFALGSPGDIAADEADALVADLNAHFAERGLRFHAPHPQRWYLQLERLPAMVTQPLSAVSGRNVADGTAQGPDAAAWRGLANEMQMLLHEHPVNRRRESRGEPAVNSLWLYGAGRLPAGLVSPFATVITGEPLARGLARCAGCALKSPEEAPDPSLSGQSALVVLESPQAVDPNADWLATWMRSQRLERGTLTLDVVMAGRTLRCEIGPYDLWKFWRRPRTLEQCLG